MRLWTIQTADVWTTLRSTGIWRAREPFVLDDRLDAYRWFVRQMEIRLKPRTFRDQMPIWFWRQWDGTRRPKPDLLFTYVSKHPDEFGTLPKPDDA